MSGWEKERNGVGGAGAPRSPSAQMAGDAGEVPREPSTRPVVGDRPTITRDRRERSDPHDPPVPENVRRLRPAEIHNAPPGRRVPARDAASRHAPGAPPALDFATGKERPLERRAAGTPVARALPPSRSSPPPSVLPPEPRADGAGAALGAPRRAPGAPRRLGVPVPVRVQADAGGRPVRIEGDTVDAVRESWLIEDRWWTDRPLRRRCWEVVTTAGRDSIVFRDLVDGRWYRQR